MRAVIDRDTGLRTGRLISHVMLYEAPGHKMLALTDGGMNTFPDLPKKVEILENAARVLRALGYETMNAACVCGAGGGEPEGSVYAGRQGSDGDDRPVGALWDAGLRACGPGPGCE